MSNQVIVVGGGLAGLTTAHTVLERGGRVVLLDKMAFLGGNSTKATSGINGALTKTQVMHKIPDSADTFEDDCVKSASGKDHSTPPTHTAPLVKVLAQESGPAVDWLTSPKFGLDLSLVSRLGGHSQPRTHRGKEKFPGFTITYALLEKLEAVEQDTNGDLARIVPKARVTRLLKDDEGHVVGVEYEKDGATLKEHGPVVICTGGFAADFSPNSLLLNHRPDLAHLPTTNGEHCTGDGIKMSQALGAHTYDIESVQVHPTGLVHPDEPDAKVKFLAAEALRGVGGLLLDASGHRFCDELGRRDYVTGEMWKGKAPFRLVLNSKGSKEIEWHCKHYISRGVMKRFGTGTDLAREMGVNPSVLTATFHKYNTIANGQAKCPYGKKFFQNAPFDLSDEFCVAIVTPVLHYTMGGLAVNDKGMVLSGAGPINGLYAAGEVAGGVHGRNRLGGNSLLDCVVYGRVCGAEVTKYLLSRMALSPIASAQNRVGILGQHLNPSMRITWTPTPVGGCTMNMEFGTGPSPDAAMPIAVPSPAAAPSAVPAVEATPPTVPTPTNPKVSLTMAEVAKHKTEKDCWVRSSQVLTVFKYQSSLNEIRILCCGN